MLLKLAARRADACTVGSLLPVPRVRSPRLLQVAHDHAFAIGCALVCAALLAWLGLTGFALSDYDVEAADAFWALRTGDFEAFLSLLPAYGGSFVLRAPFAWAPALWNGGELAVYRAVSLPGILACAGLAAFVVTRMRAADRSRRDRGVVLVALAASPIALRALEIGHPEELLGGALCVAAVLAAPSRPLVAGVLVGLAVGNKPWALVAVPVVLATVRPAAIVRTAVVSGAVALAVVAPLMVFGGAFAQSTVAMAGTGDIFQPFQVWWFLGEPGRLHQQLGLGVRELRYPPAWVMPVTRPLVLALPVLLAAAWWWWRRGLAGAGEPLLLLALVLHLRGLLDPWNIGYYALPVLLALATWEGLHRHDRPPVLTLTFVALNWLTFEALLRRASSDVQSLVYMAWALPLAAWMVHRLLLRSAVHPALQRTLKRQRSNAR